MAEITHKNPLNIVVCGGLVPDPLQKLEPVPGARPKLKNEMMLPYIFDPFAAHALYEAASIVKQNPAAKIFLVVAAPKGKLQQVMMLLGQKAPFQLVAVDAAIDGFSDARGTAQLLADAIRGISALDTGKLLLFGGWSSASRGTAGTMQILAEKLGIEEQFFGVDALELQEGSARILERIDGGLHQESVCSADAFLCAWATGELGEPVNNPQLGMQNMQKMMPAIMQAKKQDPAEKVQYGSAGVPSEKRETQVLKGMSAADIAAEIKTWMQE